MTVRFRIRTPAGQELSFATEVMFEDFVRSGDLSPDDLVYDAETGSWSPARTLPLVLGIENERAPKETPAQAEGNAPQVAAAGPATDAGPAGSGPRDLDVQQARRPDALDSLGLELAPEEVRSPEEERRAFIEKLEAERRNELDFDVGASDQGVTMERAASMRDLIRGSPPPPPRRGASGGRGGPRTPARRKPAASAGAPPRKAGPPAGRPGPSSPRSGRMDSSASRPRRRHARQRSRGDGVGKSKGGTLVRFLLGTLLVAALSAGVYFGLLYADRTAPAQDAEVSEASASPAVEERPRSAVVRTPALLEVEGLVGYDATGTTGARRGIATGT